MSNIHVVFPDDELNRAIDEVAFALHRQRRELLEQVGIELLLLAKIAYEEKSRGEIGSDGIKWDWITVGTLIDRLRTAGHVKIKPIAGTKKSQLVVAKTVKANQSLFTQLARTGVKFRDKKGAVIKGNRDRYKTGTTIGMSGQTRSKRVKVAPGSYQIGINTGLQRNSAGPGYVGSDGKGGNVMKIEDTIVTVGFGRSYSDYFDKRRKLFPDILPDAWREQLEERVEELGGKIVEETLDKKGMS